MSVISMFGAPALAAVLTLGSVAGASAAAAETTPPPDGSWGPRLTQACSRIPTRIAKVERLQQRLHASAETRGSIAFLEQRIERAEAEGHDDLVRLLTDRLAVRKDIDGTLPDVLTRLKDAREVCAKKAPAASGSAASGSASSGSAASGSASS